MSRSTGVKIKSVIKIAALTATLAAAVTFFAQAPSKATVWVLQPAGSPVPSTPTAHAWDADTFTPIAGKNTVAVPAHAFDHPEYLSINARGQMLYSTPPGLQFGDATPTDSVWFFDDVKGSTPLFARDGDGDTPRTWFLSAAGDSLFALEHHFGKTFDKDGAETTVETSARLRRRSLTETTLRTAASLGALATCTCTTGVCSESCPEWQVWAPHGVIRDYFLATRYTPGQLQTTYHETRLVHFSGNAWNFTPLPQPIESPLDASSDFRLIVSANPDGACCGNINETSDQLLLWRDRKPTVLYDEWTRFKNNDNEDVSFTVERAELAPAGKTLAYTISAYPPERNTAEMPLTEIVDLNQPAGRIKIPKADVVGWISDAELLVVESGRLVTYDARGAKKRTLPIEAKSAATVFLR